MTFYLLRHGETKEKGFYGITESHISANGEKQITDIRSIFNNIKIERRGAATKRSCRSGEPIEKTCSKNNLLYSNSIDLILTSPRERTRRTTAILNKYLKVKIVIENRLAEMNFGNWEGKEFEQIESNYPEEAAGFLNHPENFQFPGGENTGNFCKKADKTWKELQAVYSGQNIIIVSHCVWMKAVLRNYYGPEFFISGKISYAALFEVDIKKNTIVQHRAAKPLPK